ncbi:MAG: hypothetical protein ACO3JL_04470 [Myxococcota bacterium]
MYRWPDGTSVVLLPDGSVLVRGGVCVDLDDAMSDEATRLAAMGTRELVRAQPYAEAQHPDLSTTKTLIGLGRGFGWQLPAAARTGAPLRRLQSLAANLRVFSSLCHLPLLPESALALALRLASRLPRGAKAYVPGEHVLLGLALADQGLSVAVGAERKRSWGWLHDVIASLQPEAGGVLEIREASLAPAGFDAILVDTLCAPDAFAEMTPEGVPGAMVVALVHPMWRAHSLAQLSSSAWSVAEEMHEIAIRLHPGFFLSEFASDAWLLRPRNSLPDDGPDAGPNAHPATVVHEDKTHGCVELHDLVPSTLVASRLDRALRFAALSFEEPPSYIEALDEQEQLSRSLAFPRGGCGLVCARPREGMVAVDLRPWSPRDLTTLISALLLEFAFASTEPTP